MSITYLVPKLIIGPTFLLALALVGNASLSAAQTKQEPAESKPAASAAPAQTLEEIQTAYGAWEPIEGLLREEGKPSSDRGLVAWLCWQETHARQLREWGLEFHDQYPKDPRWLIWLRATVNEEPHYWKDPVQGANSLLNAADANVPVDEEVAAAWKKRYPALRAEFLASPVATRQDRVSLRSNELEHKMWLAQMALKQGSKTNFNLGEAQKEIFAIGAETPDIHYNGWWTWSRPGKLADDLLSLPFQDIWRLQADRAMSRDAFLADAKRSVNGSLRSSALAHVKVKDYANPAAAQSVEEKSSADAAWEAIEGVICIDSRINSDQHPVAWVAWFEVNGRKLRELGLKFHDEFPNDPRAISWLGLSMNRQPRYWRDPIQGARVLLDNSKMLLGDVPVDEEAQAAWNKRYPELRAEFLASPRTSLTERIALRGEELDEQLWNAKRAIGEGRKTDFDLGKAQKEILEIGAEYRSPEAREDDRGWPAKLADDLFSVTDLWRLQADKAMTKTAFLEEAKLSPSDGLRDFAVGQLRIAEYAKKPLELHFADLDGHEFDLAKMRGKVVLIDIWGTMCSICIKDMPATKGLLDKYRDKGFEVIGIVLNGEEDRQTVIDLLKKKEISWPQFLDGKRENVERFGVVSIPVILLVDRNGFVVEDIRGGGTERFEPLIRKYLGL